MVMTGVAARVGVFGQLAALLVPRASAGAARLFALVFGLSFARHQRRAGVLAQPTLAGEASSATLTATIPAWPSSSRPGCSTAAGMTSSGSFRPSLIV
jgi:hypothetical protein